MLLIHMLFPGAQYLMPFTKNNAEHQNVLALTSMNFAMAAAVDPFLSLRATSARNMELSRAPAAAPALALPVAAAAGLLGSPGLPIFGDGIMAPWYLPQGFVGGRDMTTKARHTERADKIRGALQGITKSPSHWLAKPISCFVSASQATTTL